MFVKNVVKTWEPYNIQKGQPIKNQKEDTTARNVIRRSARLNHR